MEAKTISIVLSAIRFRPFSTLTDCSCKFAQKNKKNERANVFVYCQQQKNSAIITSQPHHHTTEIP